MDKINAGTIASLRLEAGQSEKKIENAAQVFSTTPESGVFVKPGVKAFTLPDGREVNSLGYYTGEDEATADFISENSIFARTVLADKPQQIKNGARKGKWMLSQAEISTKLRKLGNSQDLRMAALAGKSFTTVPVDGLAFKSEVFETSNIDTMMFAPTESSAKKLDKNLEAKRFYEFTVTE